MRWSRYIAKPYPPRKRGWRSAARDDKDEAAPLREAPKTRKNAHKSKVDTLAHETQRLAEFAERARNTITDTVGTVVFGYDLPWSQMIVAQARRSGPGGRSRILGL